MTESNGATDGVDVGERNLEVLDGHYGLRRESLRYKGR